MADPTDTIIAAAGQIEARLMNEAPATLAAIDAAITRAAHLRVQLLVLPECAYPAYLLGSVTSYRAGDHLSGEQFVEWLSERAARFRLHIISGFVEDTGQCLHNAAVLIDDHGREIGRSRKRFLWNADHDWFAPGNDIRAFDTALGRIGVAICAEARVPEVFATLVADGAELIALPTCWINAAREPGQFYNPQVDFLIEARAREFGVPLVCADKSGLELGAVGYVGQSR
ncbi:MAG: carbon-nitrogen hydrolase family protein, partial [Phycisphaerae bacterium]